MIGSPLKGKGDEWVDALGRVEDPSMGGSGGVDPIVRVYHI